MKHIKLIKWRMPKTLSWYFWMYIVRKDRKTGDPVHVVYSISTPANAYRTYITLLPTLEYERHRNMVKGMGPNFEIRLTWLKWSVRILSRDVWWGDIQDI